MKLASPEAAVESKAAQARIRAMEIRYSRLEGADLPAIDWGTLRNFSFRRTNSSPGGERASQNFWAKKYWPV